MNVASLGLTVDTREVSNATDALNAMATAAERAGMALDALAGKAHGGISIKVVGAIATVDIAPPA